MPVKGLSDIRNLRRLGKIHLGIKENNFPKSVDYFVFQTDIPDIAKIVGEKPNELIIRFPYVEAGKNAPLFRRMYGGGGKLTCRGDGERASFFGTKEKLPPRSEEVQRVAGNEKFFDIKCHGEDCPYSIADAKKNRPCWPVMNLIFRIPAVDNAIGDIGVWQIDTKSYNTIVNVNSALDMYGGIFEKQGCGINEIDFKLSVKFETGKTKTSNKFPVLSITPLNDIRLNGPVKAIGSGLSEDAAEPAMIMGRGAAMTPDGREVFEPHDRAGRGLLKAVFSSAKAELSKYIPDVERDQVVEAMVFIAKMHSYSEDVFAFTNYQAEMMIWMMNMGVASYVLKIGK